MSEIRQDPGTPVPRPRQAGGVVGYVAELQQIDNTAPALVPEAEPEAKPEPEPEAEPPPAAEIVPLPGYEPERDDDPVPTNLYAALAADPVRDDLDGATIEFTVDRAAVPPLRSAEPMDAALPRMSEPPQPVEPARRRVRFAVFSGAAFAALAVAGVGYASLNQPPAPAALPPSQVQVPTTSPEATPSFSTGALPGVVGSTRSADPGVTPSDEVDVSAAPGVGGGTDLGDPLSTAPVPGWPVPSGDDADDDDSDDGEWNDDGQAQPEPTQPSRPTRPTSRPTATIPWIPEPTAPAPVDPEPTWTAPTAVDPTTPGWPVTTAPADIRPTSDQSAAGNGDGSPAHRRSGKRPSVTPLIPLSGTLSVPLTANPT